jgi:NAD(P)H-dependent FMN reductase
MAKIKVLAFAGSLRRDSYNKKLVAAAANGARDAGAEVTVLDLATLPMPIFDEDVEARDGVNANAMTLKALMKDHQGFLISSPEYNSSISAALKNAIDWASRPVAGEPPLGAFAGKVAGLMGASPGALGGLRGLVHLRAILGNIQVLVIPDQFALNMAHEAFDASGAIKDEKKRQIVEGIGRKVVQVASKLQG